MPHYSVATTRDKLASLIDKALAGEEVVITRHGKPTVELRVVGSQRQGKSTKEEWMVRLKDLREKHPPRKPLEGNSVLEMREEYRY